MNKVALIIAALICASLMLYMICAKPKSSMEDVIAVMPDVIQEMKEIEEETAIEQPEVNELNHLVAEYIDTKNPIILVEIGDIWRKGAYSRLSSNNKTAIKYYELAAGCGNREVAAIATAKYIEAKEEKIQQVDDVGQRLHDIYFEAIQAANTERARPVIEDLPIQFNQEYQHFQNIENLEAAPIPIPIVPQAETPLFLNDQQNVHDHYMNKITKHNIDKLKLNFTHAGDISEVIAAVNDDDELTVKSKAAVLNVIKSLTDIKHKYFDCNEIEALNLVYSYIKRQPESKTLLHNLFLQLLDCYHSGVIVCSTGKITRIVSVVGDTDNFEDQRNIYYIKQELESLAFKVREDELKQMTPEEVNAYNNGSELSADRIKAKYIEAVKREYCEKLGMLYKILSPMVEENLIGF